jgi:hypothetical protein
MYSGRHHGSKVAAASRKLAANLLKNHDILAPASA